MRCVVASKPQPEPAGAPPLMNGISHLAWRFWCGVWAVLLGVPTLLAWDDTTQILGTNWIRFGHDTTGHAVSKWKWNVGYSPDPTFLINGEPYLARRRSSLGSFTPFTQLRYGAATNYAGELVGKFDRSKANPNIWFATSAPTNARPDLNVLHSYSLANASASGVLTNRVWPTNAGWAWTTNDFVVPVWINPIGSRWWNTNYPAVGDYPRPQQVWLYFEAWRGAAWHQLGSAFWTTTNGFGSVGWPWTGARYAFWCPFPDYDLGQACVVGVYMMAKTNLSSFIYVTNRWWSEPGEIGVAVRGLYYYGNSTLPAVWHDQPQVLPIGGD